MICGDDLYPPTPCPTPPSSTTSTPPPTPTDVAFTGGDFTIGGVILGATLVVAAAAALARRFSRG